MKAEVWQSITFICCLSPLAEINPHLDHVRKLQMTLAKPVVFTRFAYFLPHSQIGSHCLAQI